MDLDFCQDIITQPQLRLGLILYSGYRPHPWAITTTYTLNPVGLNFDRGVSLSILTECMIAIRTVVIIDSTKSAGEFG